MLEKTYCLFEGRHVLPLEIKREGALCLDFDFENKRAIKSEFWNEALNQANETEDVKIRVIVTGLTPALTEFIAAFISKYTFQSWDWYMKPNYNIKPVSLVLLHWDRYTNTYWEQQVF